MDELCLSAGFTPPVIQETHNSDGIFGLVAAGMGVSIYVEGARNFALRGCVIRPFKNLAASIDTTAVWRADNPSPLIENFIKIVATHRA